LEIVKRYIYFPNIFLVGSPVLDELLKIKRTHSKRTEEVRYRRVMHSYTCVIALSSKHL